MKNGLEIITVVIKNCLKKDWGCQNALQGLVSCDFFGGVFVGDVRW